jgi:hypothetical protein
MAVQVPNLLTVRSRKVADPRTTVTLLAVEKDPSFPTMGPSDRLLGSAMNASLSPDSPQGRLWRSIFDQRFLNPAETSGDWRLNLTTWGRQHS